MWVMARHSPVDVIVHVVWATHRRRHSIALADDARLAALLHRATTQLGCQLVACGNAANHVHTVVRLAPTIALSRLVQHLKGTSSYLGRWRWQAGYFAESVAVADLTPLVRYVEHQRHHHDDSHPAESWISARCEPAEGGL